MSLNPSYDVMIVFDTFSIMIIILFMTTVINYAARGKIYDRSMCIVYRALTTGC